MPVKNPSGTMCNFKNILKTFSERHRVPITFGTQRKKENKNKR
jgi:hypothetical protein